MAYGKSNVDVINDVIDHERYVKLVTRDPIGLRLEPNILKTAGDAI